ncbi:MAG: hypothetical protein HC846_08870 [Blastocatellia bacterium]|nr:hypothetical protein [Blastocatellia bacterium]
MKRILLSILCGILFPILYMAIIGSIDDFVFPNYDLTTREIYGQASMGLILAPIAIPLWIYDFIRFNQYFGLREFFDTFWFRLIWTVGFNISLYTILSYFLLWYLGNRKSSTQTNYQNPPSPPQF